MDFFRANDRMLIICRSSLPSEDVGYFVGFGIQGIDYNSESVTNE